MVLPGASGFSAIAALKGSGAASIIAMSGHADEEVRKDVLLLGAVALLEKPFDNRQLALLLQDVSRS